MGNNPVMIYIILGVAVAYGAVKIGPPIAHATVTAVEAPVKGVDCMIHGFHCPAKAATAPKPPKEKKH